MAHDVHLHVCFACDQNDAVAELAKQHLVVLSEDDSEDGIREARMFLKALSARSGHNPGQKGGLSLWGIVGNYTDEDAFVTVLKPFWKAMLSEVDGGPMNFEHILVFAEHEQRERATAIEIFFEQDEHTGIIVGDLKIIKHDCPFAWMQF